MLEKRTREREVKELQDLLYKESKKVEDYKCKVLRDTGSALVAEEELNLREANSLGIKNAIDVREIEDMRAENARLKTTLDEKECDFKVKEIKLKNEIEQLQTEVKGMMLDFEDKEAKNKNDTKDLMKAIIERNEQKMKVMEEEIKLLREKVL